MALEALGQRRPLTVVEEQARVGRSMLVGAMTSCGFTNYPAEWWHFDFGNAFWRHFGGHGPGPVYGIVESP
jgi:D-alanyl-D-alanine dipeptidase